MVCEPDTGSTWTEEENMHARSKVKLPSQLVPDLKVLSTGQGHLGTGNCQEKREISL